MKETYEKRLLLITEYIKEKLKGTNASFLDKEYVDLLNILSIADGDFDNESN